MVAIALTAGDGVPLIDQIVSGIRLQIEERRLRPGTRLPSIRGFASAHKVSRFTVVEAYDRLVAMGYVLSRPGAGFYTKATPHRAAAPAHPESGARNEDLVWLIRRLLDGDGSKILAGGPWLPNDWLDKAGIRRSLQAVARKAGPCLLEYGNALGYAPLRELLCVQLAEMGVTARASQVLLTHGVSQALDLVMRCLLRPGDAALVDDPGYYNLFGNLRFHGVRMLPVARGRDGPDLAALDALAAEHRPKVYFTQSAMQNPTGTDIAPHQGFRLLQAAERHDFWIVEDDIFRDLQAHPQPRLATLDQLNRVIYVRSFSKTLSGSLRVGFLAAHHDLVKDISDIKMLTDITSSQHAERMLYHLLSDGHYRKFVERLRQRVDEARGAGMRVLARAGLELFSEPDAGMFLWARMPQFDDSIVLAEAAAGAGILMAPGALFRPYLERSAWMRFNVATVDDRRLQRWLTQTAMRNAESSAS